MNETILKDAIFKVGKVISVEGRIIKVEVDKTKNTSHLLYNGDVIRNVAVNSYVKISKGFIDIIGKVDGEFIIEDKTYREKEYLNENQKIKRVLIVSLLGFFSNKGFERGIKELPLINNDCYLLDRKEFQAVHNFIRKDDEPLFIGTLTHEQGQPISIGINDLFASHIGIFGNTGSGKSYTLSKIYSELFKKFNDRKKFQQNAKFLMFDFNGEYYKNDEKRNSITEHKKVYNLSTRNDEGDRLIFREEDILDKDLFSIIANATEKTQKPFISRTLDFYKKVSKSDSPIVFFENIMKKRVIDIYKMADKAKALLLLDYFKEILPPKYDEFGIEIGLESDVNFHNVRSEFTMADNSVFLRSNPEYIKETILYKQVDKYSFPEDFISKIIHFLYLQLIYDVFANRADNAHKHNRSTTDSHNYIIISNDS